MREGPSGRGMEEDQEACIPDGRCRRCGSQDTAGSGAILPEVAYASNMLVRHCVFHFTMLSLYIPVFTYNMGTWAITQAESTHLSSFQRTQLNC